MNDNIIKSSKRETNFELLRVVCMIMVVAIHFIGHGKVIDAVNVYSFNGVAIKFLKELFMVADNSFVLISGYFMSKSKFKIRKVFSLWVQVLFYSVVLFLVSVALGKAEFSLKDALYSVTPIFSKQYWFFSSYILLYLLSPLINIIIDNIDQKKALYCSYRRFYFVFCHGIGSVIKRSLLFKRRKECDMVYISLSCRGVYKNLLFREE